MTDLFLFGTLRHLPLLQVVSGDPSIGDQICAAYAPDHVVMRVKGQGFPMLNTQPDTTAEGVVVENVNAAVLARIDYYERAFGYTRAEIDVICDGVPRKAAVYQAEPGRWAAEVHWNLDDWVAQFGAMTTDAAGTALAAYGRLSAEELGRYYPSMLTRSASRMRAQAKGGEATGDKTVTLHQHSTPYTQFFSVEEVDLSFSRFDGTISAPINRSVFIGVDCALVLPYDPVRDRVLLIEQFRAGPYLRSDPSPWVMEPIAGRIDPGETPQDAARREAVEEAGITLHDLHQVGAAYPSPGTMTEFFYIYVGLCDLPDDVAGLGGLASEAEDIKSHLLEWGDFESALDRGAFHVVPLMLAGQWLARHRERIRRGDI